MNFIIKRNSTESERHIKCYLIILTNQYLQFNVRIFRNLLMTKPAGSNHDISTEAQL